MHQAIVFEVKRETSAALAESVRIQGAVNNHPSTKGKALNEFSALVKAVLEADKTSIMNGKFSRKVVELPPVVGYKYFSSLGGLFDSCSF
jgi:hypothetical protein